MQPAARSWPVPSPDALHQKGSFSENEIGDLRFRRLLSDADWQALPSAVRARFTKRLAHGATAVYVGHVLESHIGWMGHVFAQLLRLIGGPLPLSTDCGVPSIVTVTEDHAGEGQVWTRIYTRTRGFPQVIQSAKRFSGGAGLEEYVTSHIGMALTVHVEDGVLLFRSVDYFVRFGEWRIPIPLWLAPGALTVSHADCGDGRFVFGLDIVHPVLGRIIRQSVMFQDASLPS
jgi:hypothetical protein